MAITGMQNLRDISANGPAGMTYSMRTGQAVGMGTPAAPLMHDAISDPNSQVYQRMQTASNNGYPYVSTGYLYGNQPLSLQSKTYQPQSTAPGGTGNVGTGPTNPGQMTWDQWATNMQNNYGTGAGGTLGGAANGSGGITGGGGTPANYPGGYTGYGNSSVGVQNGSSNVGGSTPNTQTVVTTPPTVTHPTTTTNSGPVAPPNGALNGVQQLINQAPVVKDPVTGQIKPATAPTTTTTAPVTVSTAPVNTTLPVPPAPYSPYGPNMKIQLAHYNNKL